MITTGEQSCSNASLTTMNGGDIYLSGGYDWVGDDDILRGSIETTMEYDVICAGYNGCSKREISNAHNLYCGGWSSCSEVYQ